MTQKTGYYCSFNRSRTLYFTELNIILYYQLLILIWRSVLEWINCVSEIILIIIVIFDVSVNISPDPLAHRCLTKKQKLFSAGFLWDWSRETVVWWSFTKYRQHVNPTDGRANFHLLVAPAQVWTIILTFTLIIKFRGLTD